MAVGIKSTCMGKFLITQKIKKLKTPKVFDYNN